MTENYQRRFAVSYPNEELPAGRPLETTPAYEVWKRQRAVFGQAYGMEAVNYFAPEGEPTFETPSFRRSNAFGPVGEECRAVREAVGINEIHNFGKYEVTGPGAADWLDRIMAGRIPSAGRIALSPMLSPKGKLIGDFTISHLAEGRFPADRILRRPGLSPALVLAAPAAPGHRGARRSRSATSARR